MGVVDRNVDARSRFRHAGEACSIGSKNERTALTWSRAGRVPRGWFAVAQTDDQGLGA
jgi:hypothetical protein